MLRFLNVYVRPGLKLKDSLPGIRAVITLERALDIHRMRVVTLDEIAVIAIHDPHQIGERPYDALGEAPPESGETPGKIDHEIVETRAMARPLADEQGLHQRHILAPISGFFCRPAVRSCIRHICHAVSGLNLSPTI
jgi:hypothetical protein